MQPVRAAQHIDDIHAGEFGACVRAAADARFDVMLEAKYKDVALLRLRAPLARIGLLQRIW